MKQKRHEEGRFTRQGQGLGTVTEDMVRARAREIAVINGRAEDQLLDSDLTQAWRELTGEERLHPSATAEETLAEDQRSTGITDTGHRVEAVPTPDEQTFAEKLVEEGVQDAEHDQMVRATRDSLKRETE
jgi:hypothetical protein